MKLILTATVKGLGQAGALVDVADGHARNYLIPRGLAQPATPGALAATAAAQAQAERVARRARESAIQQLRRLDGLTVRLMATANEHGHLYAAVTGTDIARSLDQQHHQAVEAHAIDITRPIKAIGQHQVTINLGHGQQARITVTVDQLV